MGYLSPWHIAIIVLVLLLVFGARRLPELGRGLGSGMREFKDAVTGSGSHHETPPTEVTAGTQQAPPAPQQPMPVQQPAAQPPTSAPKPPADPSQQPTTSGVPSSSE